MPLARIGPVAKTSVGFSYIKKLMSPRLSYVQDAKLRFLLHDIHMAKQIMTKLTVGQSRIFPAGRIARESVPRRY